MSTAVYERKSAGSGGDLRDVVTMLNDIGRNFEEFKANQDERFRLMESRIGRAALFGGGSPIESAVRGTLTGEMHKSLSVAFRALLSGDQGLASKAFAEYASAPEYKAMSVGTDSSGGYLVLPQYSAETTRIMAEISPVSELARTIPLDSGDAFEEVIDRDQAEAQWVGETGTRGDTDNPDIGKFRVELHEIFSQPKATQKLIDTSSFNIVDWLLEKIGEAFATTESAAFHGGNGVGKPRGFLTYPTAATADATRAWGTLEHVNTGASGAFATPSASVNPTDVLVDTVGALRAQYRPGAVWLMSRTTAALCRKLKDAEGRHVWTDNLQQGVPPILLGFPVEISEDMPAVAANSLSIAFGNFRKAYTIPRMRGSRFLLDPYSEKPYVKVYVYQRVSGDVNNFEAIKLVRFGT